MWIAASQDSSFKEIVMAQKVAGELYESITGQLFEIGRQLRQPNGYPFDPEVLKASLQRIIQGDFPNEATEAAKRRFSTTPSVIGVGPLHKLFDPRQFFTSRPGFEVEESSREILPCAPLVKPTGDMTAPVIAYADLNTRALDSTIRENLMGDNAVELWEVADLLLKQKNGEVGPLLTGGKSNLFLVKGFVVGGVYYEYFFMWVHWFDWSTLEKKFWQVRVRSPENIGLSFILGKDERVFWRN